MPLRAFSYKFSAGYVFDNKYIRKQELDKKNAPKVIFNRVFFSMCALAKLISEK